MIYNGSVVNKITMQLIAYHFLRINIILLRFKNVLPNCNSGVVVVNS
jgi:hypothetical protein